MNDFCPEGYLSTQQAVYKAAENWFPPGFAVSECLSPETDAAPKNPLEAAVHAFSQPSVPDIPDQWMYIFRETLTRLRNHLHQGSLKAYYFTRDGRHALAIEFWATKQANGAIETGTYWPFDYALFVSRAEFDALFSEPPIKKRPLPEAMASDVVAVLRKLDHLSREQQREELRKVFEQYHLTDSVLREAQKQVPRKPGRRRRIPK